MNYKSALIVEILKEKIGKQGIMCPVCTVFVTGGILDMRDHLETLCDEVEEMEKIFSTSEINELNDKLGLLN